MRVAAVQMALRFYESPEEYSAEMDAWTARAKDAGAEVVVFPEDAGLSLLCIDDYDIARDADSVATLAAGLVRRNWLAVIMGALTRDLTARKAIFLHKAPRARDIYTASFSTAAQKHGLHIVAGSLPLPVEGERDRDVFNVSYVFGPRGETLGIVRKVDLIEMERDDLHLSGGEIADLPIFEIPGLTFGVAICLDTWNPQIVGHLASRGAKLIASPQANPFPWTEEEKRGNREGLWSRCRELEVWGIQAMGVGELAGVAFEGQSAIIAPGGAGIIAEAQSSTGEELVVADIDVGD